MKKRIKTEKNKKRERLLERKKRKVSEKKNKIMITHTHRTPNLPSKRHPDKEDNPRGLQNRSQKNTTTPGAINKTTRNERSASISDQDTTAKKPKMASNDDIMKQLEKITRNQLKKEEVIRE